MKNEKWFSLSVEQIEKKLKTNAASGLSPKAARSRSQNSDIEAVKIKGKSFKNILFELFADFAWLIFVASAILAWTFGNIYLGASITVLLILNALISVGIYYRSEKFEKNMEKHFMPTVKTIRGGRLYNLDHSSLVAGDVIIIEKGDVLCCDARLVTSESLKVTMQVENDKYISLDKQAQGCIAENANLVENHVNMVHAGSVVEDGSARGIVVAVGKYTYISAKLGTVYHEAKQEFPKEIEKMRRTSTSISFWVVLSVLPFCILSLLLSKLTGGAASLSLVFITAMSLAVSTMPRLLCSLCKIFFIFNMQILLKNKDAAALRSSRIYDRLSRVKYLFLLDGAALTDGKLHFEGAICADGNVFNDTRLTKTGQQLADLAGLYYSGESSSLSTGVSSADKILVPLKEFLNEAKCDIEALKIRCNILSCHNENSSVGTDKIIYTDRGAMLVLSVSKSDEIINRCGFVYSGLRKAEITKEKIEVLRNICAALKRKGSEYLIFSTSTMNSNDSDSERCFVGIVAFSEGVDKKAAEKISRLERNGIKVICFDKCADATQMPLIPQSISFTKTVSPYSFSSRDLPLTYNFGKYDRYVGFSSEEILLLLKYAHSHRMGVAVIGFTDYAPQVLSEADVFITCSEIDNKNKKDTRIQEFNESLGETSSASCMQVIKKEADVIITRPSKEKGGLDSLFKVFVSGKTIRRNLSSFFLYLTVCMIIRIAAVGIPMLFGYDSLDARHVVLVSTVFDLFALMLFCCDMSGYDKRNNYNSYALKREISENIPIIFTALVSVIVCMFVPYLVELSGIFGVYIYKMEYMLVSLFLLHVHVICSIRFVLTGRIREVIKNKIFLSLLAVSIALLLAMGIFKSFGAFFGIEKFMLSYTIASIITSFVFYPLLVLFNRIFKSKEE